MGRPVTAKIRPPVAPSHGPLISTPKHKRPICRESPHLSRQPLLSPLPPSSPPTSLSQDNHLEFESKEDEKENETDPFGFLAMEKLWKARKKRALVLRKSEIPVSRAKSGRGKVAGDTAIDSAWLKSHRSTHKPSSLHSGRKRNLEISPTALSDRPSRQPSSPCQQAIRRKSEARKENGSKQTVTKRRLSRSEDGDQELEIVQLEAMRPKGAKKRRARKQSHAREGIRKSVNRKRITLRKLPMKAQDGELSALDHLDDEDREVGSSSFRKESCLLALQKFERQREERLGYYRRLDSYRLSKEKVWIV